MEGVGVVEAAALPAQTDREPQPKSGCSNNTISSAQYTSTNAPAAVHIGLFDKSFLQETPITGRIREHVLHQRQSAATALEVLLEAREFSLFSRPSSLFTTRTSTLQHLSSIKLEPNIRQPASPPSRTPLRFH